ncbi:hypothetical protein ONZ51_g8899 [Trametes cubensis]|uniref:Core domain-containing protein n=1 Tax=Trametes cubensis TaxID=1111947 RepID=A0AAD7TMD0_9APHY|nr:hypothetical protein ONZ51_g8899 [Trametes cubensis]
MHTTPAMQLLRSFILSPTQCTRTTPFSATRAFASCSAAAVSRVPRTSSTIASTSHSFRGRAIAHTRRNFASTSSARAAQVQHPPTQRAELVSYPSPSSIRQEDEDSDDPEVDLVPPEQASLQMTERAAEQLRAVAQKQGGDAALRVAVESGGCHGYQYRLQLAKKKEPDDYHFSHPRIKPSNIYVDAISLPLMNGATIDYATELIGSSFKVIENPQVRP